MQHERGVLCAKEFAPLLCEEHAMLSQPAWQVVGAVWKVPACAHVHATGHGPCSRPFVLLDMSSAFDLITWMSLISLPCGSTLYNNVILFGKAWIFVQGLVLVKALGVAHMPDGLQGLHTNMLGLYWIFLSLPHV